MNYSNMIEEKHLKKTFIIATLISTIVGTFTTGINLFDRVAERRRQKHTDSGQDDKIKALEERINQTQRGGGRRLDREDELRESLQSGGQLVRRAYDRDYARLGSRFAEGDLIAETQLQSQIITLQGTVIKLLEEALFTGRAPDINKLYNASEFARDGSIRALRDQYQRMLQAAPVRRPIGPVRRISSTPTLRDRPPASASIAASSSSRALVPVPAAPSPDGPLFCRYATDLQRSRLALDETFRDGRASACPDCAAVIPFEPGRAWRIYKEVSVERVTRGDRRVEHMVEEIPYVLTNRFIVKCHRDGGGYACVLCYRFRDRDTVCESMADLANHVLKKHDVREYEAEPDIEEVVVAMGPPNRVDTF